MNRTAITQWLQSRNIMRLLRVVLGSMILVQAVMTKDLTLSVAAAVFTLMPLLNIGCCAYSPCNAKDSACTPKKSIRDESLLDKK